MNDNNIKMFYVLFYTACVFTIIAGLITQIWPIMVGGGGYLVYGALQQQRQRQKRKDNAELQRLKAKECELDDLKADLVQWDDSVVIEVE